jgi:hypothetical protein
MAGHHTTKVLLRIFKVALATFLWRRADQSPHRPWTDLAESVCARFFRLLDISRDRASRADSSMQVCEITIRNWNKAQSTCDGRAQSLAADLRLDASNGDHRVRHQSITFEPLLADKCASWISWRSYA